MTSLKENTTWKLVELLLSRKTIWNRWVYRVKQIVWYKEQLAVQWFIHGQASTTMKPLARFGQSLAATFNVAANEHLELAQFDVETPFLYVEIKELYLHNAGTSLTFLGLRKLQILVCISALKKTTSFWLCST